MSVFYSQTWAKPYLTPSIACVLLNQSPLHARLACPYYTPDRPKSTAAMDEGTIVDRLTLGGTLDDIEIIDVDDWRTKAAKEARDAAIAAGKIVVKRADYERCAGSAAYVRREMMANPDVRRVLENGRVQHRLFWGDAPACSTEPDLSDTETALDLKRTAIAPTADNWRRHVASMDYGIQAAAVLEATGCRRFGWIVVESKPPFCVVVHWASEAFLDWAEVRWIEAKKIWHKCVSNNHWPGYETGEIDPMPWQYSGDDIGDFVFTEDAAE